MLLNQSQLLNCAVSAGTMWSGQEMRGSRVLERHARLTHIAESTLDPPVY